MDNSPSMAEKLARLAALEAQFHETLEAAKLDALAEFAAGAGHEINNPLTVISGRAQLLLRDETDPERRHTLALISAQAMRVYEMIADLMLFARPPRPELQKLDLTATIDTVVAEFSPRCASRNASIGRTGQSGPISIDADPAQLAVAIRALVQNALEAIPNGGHIEIDVETDATDANGPIRLRVRDDGPGIKPEERQHIFDPFYSARQAGRGLGLGLSKAWRIVTGHGGRIDVDSPPNGGAIFTIVLSRLHQV